MAYKKNRRNTHLRQETTIDWAELGKLTASAIFLIVCIVGIRMIEDVPMKSISVSSNIVRMSIISMSEIVRGYEVT